MYNTAMIKNKTTTTINPGITFIPCTSVAHRSADSFSLTVFPAAPDVSEQIEYPDDFEEAEVDEEYVDEVALVHAAAPQQPHDDALEEEFQLCDAGGLTIILKGLKEKG